MWLFTFCAVTETWSPKTSFTSLLCTYPAYWTYLTLQTGDYWVNVKRPWIYFLLLLTMLRLSEASLVKFKCKHYIQSLYINVWRGKNEISATVRRYCMWPPAETWNYLLQSFLRSLELKDTIYIVVYKTQYICPFRSCVNCAWFQD